MSTADPAPTQPGRAFMRARRSGFSLAEFLMVVLVLGILAGIALPSYQKVTYRARAATIINDLRVVRNAVYQYQLETNEWPADVYPGIVPPELETHISGVDFVGEGYRLDWDNWDPVYGVSVLLSSTPLESALVATLQESEGTFVRLNDRYMYVVESSF